ncbi:MAG: hypothetical protein H6702_09225 [Myxococcales bacterium]|nr:hypothetical protein [Myxococcales bacterium]
MSENNMPSVGKDQVMRGREMHWIRIDRYFVGDDAAPRSCTSPIVCQQCEMAPCENVCPVAATDAQPRGAQRHGLQPLHRHAVLREQLPVQGAEVQLLQLLEGQPEVYHMVRNPDVTVRFRGVMEKCTYCVQRINRTSAGRSPVCVRPRRWRRGHRRDRQVACQQACPTQAITFGDINDKDSEVSKWKAQDRDYQLLSELNLKPRTSYLAKVRNPNPKPRLG